MGACAARVSLAYAPAIARTGLAQPLPVVDAWGAYGGACFAILGTTIAIATGALVVLLRSPEDGRPISGAFVTALAAICVGGAAAWPFVFSSDLYAYAAYGEMAARGFDPNALVPANAHGPSLDAARIQWHGDFPVCVYGPLFVALAGAVWSATHAGGAGVPVAALRLLAVLAFLGSVPLVDRALAGTDRTTRTRITLAYGLNPVMLWSAAEGHNDAFVLLAAAFAAIVLRRGGVAAAGAILGLSATLKAPGAVLAATFGLDALARRKSLRGALGAAAGVAIAATIAVPRLLPALRSTREHGRYLPAASLQALVGLEPALVLAALALAFGLLRSAGGHRDGSPWIGIALVAGLPNAYPWYALWLVPLALAGAPSAAATALYGATIFGVLRYLPDATGTMTAGATRLVALGTMIPLLVVCAHTIQKKALATS